MNIEIANRLVNLRKEKGFSQEQLAEKIGVSRQAVSKWERSEASPDTDNLIMLARLYEVSLDELLRTEDEIPKPEAQTEQTEEIPPETESEEKEKTTEPPTAEQPQETPDPSTEEATSEKAEGVPAEESASEVNNIGKIIAGHATKMTNALWTKLLLTAFFIPASLLSFGRAAVGIFFIIFALGAAFSVVDAVYSRDLGKFKMWAVSMALASSFAGRSQDTAIMICFLLLTPAYELILWFVRQNTKKK